jgi:hypothetical protein
MVRVVQSTLFVLAAGLAFASCTCHRDLPEPPADSVAKSRGFGSLPTPRRDRAPEALAELTPPVPTIVVTPPAAAEVELPENFPSDVPVFKDAKPFAVQQLAGNARNVLFNADAPSPEIFTYYRDEMQSNGWTKTQEYQTREQSFLSFKKGRMIANMTISKDPKGGKQQIIGIMYQEEDDLPFPEF